jgi:hypothetical protein
VPGDGHPQAAPREERRAGDEENVPRARPQTALRAGLTNGRILCTRAG